MSLYLYDSQEFVLLKTSFITNWLSLKGPTIRCFSFEVTFFLFFDALYMAREFIIIYIYKALILDFFLYRYIVLTKCLQIDFQQHTHNLFIIVTSEYKERGQSCK